MKIVCDPPKRLANLEKHGLDLTVVTAEFFERSVVVAAKAGRFKAIGPLGDSMVALIFKPLGSEAVSLISLRPASKKEQLVL